MYLREGLSPKGRDPLPALAGSSGFAKAGGVESDRQRWTRQWPKMSFDSREVVFRYSPLMSEILDVACDEAGHTRPDLLQKDQRMFAFSSVAIGDAEAF